MGEGCPAYRPGFRMPAHLRFLPFLASFTAPMMRRFFSPHALQSAMTTAPGTG
jgi:hypothetical protein